MCLFLMPSARNFGKAKVTKKRVQKEMNQRFISYAECQKLRQSPSYEKNECRRK